LIVSESDDWEAKVAEYDEAISNRWEVTTLEDRDWLAWALIERGQALEQLGRLKEALASYEELVARFDDAPEADIQERVAIALAQTTLVLRKLKRPEDALAVCDAVLSRFGETADERFAPSISYALQVRGQALLTLGRVWEAAETYQRHLHDFPPATLTTLVGLAKSLSQLRRHEEAVAAIDAYLTARADAAEPLPHRWTAYYLLAKARHLIVLGKSCEALATCEEVIDLLTGDADPNARELLAGALLRKAAIVALDEETDAARAALDEALMLRTEDDQMLLVNFEPDELEELKHGLARLSAPEALDSNPDLLWVQDEGEARYGIKLFDFRNIPDDLRDLD
jgi:tetratricopeptide (TPR) repeat protein